MESKLVDQWTDWNFAVRVHEGKEPEFVEQFNEWILNHGQKELPDTVWRFSRFKKLLSVQPGELIGGKANSFLAVARTRESVYPYDSKEGVLMEIRTQGLGPALFIARPTSLFFPRVSTFVWTNVSLTDICCVPWFHQFKHKISNLHERSAFV